MDQIQIVFSEAVYGFDPADLSLSRDGGANLLTDSQTLSTSDSIHWTLGNLSRITDALGTYDLTLTAAGSGITDLSGKPLAANAAEQWVRRTPFLGDVVQILRNPGTSDAFGASVAMSGDTVVVGAGDTTYVFDAGTGDLRLTLATPGGGPVGASESIVAVIAASRESLYIFDATTGSVVRTISGSLIPFLDGVTDFPIYLASCIAVSGNMVVMGVRDMEP